MRILEESLRRWCLGIMSKDLASRHPFGTTGHNVFWQRRSYNGADSEADALRQQPSHVQMDRCPYDLPILEHISLRPVQYF